MEKSLNAYSDAHIKSYFEKVKTEGLTEHGFPRLTANIGILISHKRRTDLLPIFMEMMEFCCYTIPRVKAANDFSVKEIIFCINELEKNKTVSEKDIARWKGYLASIDPYTCYNKYAATPTDKVHNWALFTAVSEFMRQREGLCDSTEFIDIQIASQLQWLDENGMYMDGKPLCSHQPIVYDLVPRGLFAVMLHFGYRGVHYKAMDDCIKGAALHTLKMQSTTGEIAFGGRSNQFLHNEAHLALIFEYEANRYAKEGNTLLAARFKEAARRAIDSIEAWFEEKTVRHIKNRFPIESKYGCEDYAYFDKYMITAASFLYVAYTFCDDSIKAAELPDTSAEVFVTSKYFHKAFAKCGEYCIEIDTEGDPNYDASGLGRVHRRGAPAAICLSLPCPAAPSYTLDTDSAISFSLCAAIKENGEWIFGADERTKYDLLRVETTDCAAFADVECLFENGKRVTICHKVSESGVEIELRGKGEIAFGLPALSFDGENESVIRAKGGDLSVSYMGWVCRYTTSGEISELAATARNRNGHYRTFYTHGRDLLKIKIDIAKE